MKMFFSKRAASLVLALLIVISTITVGAVSTAAAETGLAATAAANYYLAGTMNNWSTSDTPMTKATDISGTTIYYAGPLSQQYQFKVTDGSNWYGTEIMTNALYDTSLEMYEYGTTDNCWPAESASYYVVFTTSNEGNAISCVTKLPTSSGGTTVTTNGKKPTIYVRDASNSGFAIWAWTSNDTNLFSGSWETRPTSSLKSADTNGWKAYTADVGIGLNLQYSVKVTKGTSLSTDEPWFETIAHGDFWIDIDANGDASFYNSNPDSTTVKTKATAFSDALWVDTQADEITQDDDVTALVKWYQKSSSEYYLYLPSGMNLTDVPVYHSYSSLSINGTAVKSGSTFTFNASSSYTLTGDVSGKLNVMQSDSVYTMYMTGSSDLPNDTSTSLVSKENICIEDGNVYTADVNGAIKVQDSVKKIKGRGNSSWEASYLRYGKYAYNLTLKNKTKDITGGKVKTKKYSILANNADESMMRNMVIYSLADKIGLDYTPTLRVYDFYDNGNYLGSYTVCEKVEVGSSGLLSGVDSLDDANEEVNPDIESAEHKTNGKTSSTPGFYKYVDSSDPADITGGYLLEFELSERFDDEISGFVSNKGQDVVVKYPELATKNEVLYIMDLFNKAESAIYSSSANIDEISKYIDVESFAKMYLIQELSKNLDAAQTSYYIYKESDTTGDGKLHAAPVWDYDWTCGQYTGDRDTSGGTSSVYTATGWNTRYRYIDNDKTKDINLQAKLCECSGFWNLVKSVWHTNMNDAAASFVFDDSKYTLSNSTSTISEYYNMIKDSVAMNESRWGFIANDLVLDWNSADTGDTLDVTTKYLNDWLFDRITWINSNIGAKATVAAPQLTVNISDDAGEIQTTGTQEIPTQVRSDLIFKLTSFSSNGILYTLTVNGKAVKPNADGTYTVELKVDEAAEISYTAVARNTGVASTDTDCITKNTASFYVIRKDLPKIIGDADLDGAVTIIDATRIQRILASIVKPSSVALKCADSDQNGKVSIKDATHIQRYLVNLSCSKYIGQTIE